MAGEVLINPTMHCILVDAQIDTTGTRHYQCHANGFIIQVFLRTMIIQELLQIRYKILLNTSCSTTSTSNDSTNQ